MIERYFEDSLLSQLKNDFSFLLKKIKESNGEYDLAIRKNSFNIYYKGNSLAYVKIKKESYQVRIHYKFFSDSLDSKAFKTTRRKEYIFIELSKKKLHSFFTTKRLNILASNIKKENNGEEITFEHAIITDNSNREELIIIDRQIEDKQLRRRMDLLALKRIKDNKYQFLILEVKLGNNRELIDKVEHQLNYYVNHIKTYFKDYKQCYEKYYIQKKELELIELPKYSEIEILEPVDGMIIVGGYSGMAQHPIERLKNNGFKVTQFKYEI